MEFKLIKYVFEKSYLYLKVDFYNQIFDIEYIVKDVKFSLEIFEDFLLNKSIKKLNKNFEKFFMVRTEKSLINEDWFKMLFYDFSFIRLLIKDKIVAFDNNKEV